MFTRIETSGADVHLHLYGALDGTGARALQAGVAAVPWGPQGDFLVNLAGVDLIDEAGLGALIFLGKRLAAHRRRLRLTGVRGSWLARLHDLGLSADLSAVPAGAGRPVRGGRGRDCIACRRPAQGPEGE